MVKKRIVSLSLSFASWLQEQIKEEGGRVPTAGELESSIKTVWGKSAPRVFSRRLGSEELSGLNAEFRKITAEIRKCGYSGNAFPAEYVICAQQLAAGDRVPTKEELEKLLPGQSEPPGL